MEYNTEFVNDRHVDQIGGDHYDGEYQHWDWAIDTRLPPMEYAATKYISRWWKKNGVEDLEKARSYIEKLRYTARNQPGWLAGNRPERNERLLKRYFESSDIRKCESLIISMIDIVMNENHIDIIIDDINMLIQNAQKATGNVGNAGL